MSAPTTTVLPYPALPFDATYPRMWRHILSRHADREVLVTSLGGGEVERLTYAEADARSLDLARSLLALGVVKGTRVGLLLPNGSDFLVAFLGAARIGAVVVPLNTLFQPLELSWLLRDADIHTVVTTPTIVGKSASDRVEAAVAGLEGVEVRGTEGLRLPALPHLRHVVSLAGGDRRWFSDLGAKASPELQSAAEATVRPADDFFIIYTSGSTSNPKGVIHAHGPAVRNSHHITVGHDWDEGDRLYVPMAFFWVGGLVFGILGPVQIGATVLTEQRFDAGEALRLLEQERATYALGWPHIGSAMAAHADFATTDLSGLREGYQQPLLAPEHRAPEPGLRVRHLGMTETCSSMTWWPPHEPLPESKRGSLGYPGPGFEMRIVDEGNGPVGPGTEGEICVRGEALMRGMVGRLWSDVVDADGWYHTGDVGWTDEDGHVYFAGRMDDLIKSAGANVSPAEVEAVLDGIPGVRLAYVVGVGDGDRGAKVTGIVVASAGATLTPEDLTARCRAQLAAFKVPKRWIILDSADSLPYTTTNKLDRRKLVAQLEGAADDHA